MGTPCAAMPGPTQALVPAQAFRRERVEIGLPDPALVTAEPIQRRPGIDPGLMPIVEPDADRVVADRLDLGQADTAFAGYRHLLARVVALHLGRRAFDAQQLGRVA